MKSTTEHQIKGAYVLRSSAYLAQRYENQFRFVAEDKHRKPPVHVANEELAHIVGGGTPATSNSKKLFMPQYERPTR